MTPELLALEKMAGIHFMGQPNAALLEVDSLGNVLAMDAQPALVTSSNAGVPAMFTTFVDPRIIDILVKPMRAVEIVGEEVKKGDWITDTAMFIEGEDVGQVSSYGDYSENGISNANINYPQRQSYHYQTITKWGEREVGRAGAGMVDLAFRKNKASISTLNLFQNASYFFGVANLENYGLLNDPSLLPAISPAIKAAGGTAWAVATANEILHDIQLMYQQLVSQTANLVDLETNMTLAMSSQTQTWLTDTSDFNVNVFDRIKKNFPNMKIKTAPEYTTASGNFVQLIADEVEGVRTASCAFTEKLRAHPVVIQLSSFMQKKSQGTWGTIIYRPVFIVGMLGV
jgi:hypothetical protein